MNPVDSMASSFPVSNSLPGTKPNTPNDAQRTSSGLGMYLAPILPWRPLTGGMLNSDPAMSQGMNPPHVFAIICPIFIDFEHLCFIIQAKS